MRFQKVRLCKRILCSLGTVMENQDSALSIRSYIAPVQSLLLMRVHLTEIITCIGYTYKTYKMNSKLSNLKELCYTSISVCPKKLNLNQCFSCYWSYNQLLLFPL